MHPPAACAAARPYPCRPRRCAGVPFSLLALANNCAVAGTFAAMQQRFSQLYRKRLYVHHYTEYMEQHVFDEAFETIAALAEDYRILDDVRRPPPLERFFPSGGGFGQNSLR
jgi:tubulin epsilon